LSAIFQRILGSGISEIKVGNGYFQCILAPGIFDVESGNNYF
jgi:hypothetical protein